MVEKIVKAGIITGIIFAGFIMVAIGVSVFPMSIRNFNDDILNQSDKELETAFLESKEYIAFSERFPEHEREFFRTPHSAEFEVGAMNIETKNQLLMYMQIYGYNENRIEKNVHCEPFTHDESEQLMHANGVLVKQFIETTKCLD